MTDVEVDGVREYSAENLRQSLFSSSTKRRVAELHLLNERLVRKGRLGCHGLIRTWLIQGSRDIYRGAVHDITVLAWHICILR